MDYLQRILIAFELHDMVGVKTCFEHGVHPNLIFRGKPLVYELINMYTRGPKFKECIKEFVDHGLEFDDKVLLTVLLDDALELDKILSADYELVYKRYTLDCTFTPLYEASLLHICAEYNHVSCAKILVQHGLDVNVRAGVDGHGFGGHTPIFHTVNQDANKSLDMMQYLISMKADLTLTVRGLIWGKGYDWETYIPAVNPIGYAMMGLLRQFQRTEEDVYKIVILLQQAAYDMEYKPENIPNRYLYTK